MTPEDIYLENLYETFATKGWKQVMDSLDDYAVALSDINCINNERELFMAKGKIEALKHVMSLESLYTIETEA